MMCVKLPIGFEVEITLHVLHRKEKRHLRADSNHSCLKRTKRREAAAVGGKLVVEIAYHPKRKLLRQELRRPPVEVPIDAILIICARIDETVDLKSAALRPGIRGSKFYISPKCRRRKLDLGKSSCPHRR
jgi:hypothetical protein